MNMEIKIEQSNIFFENQAKEASRLTLAAASTILSELKKDADEIPENADPKDKIAEIDVAIKMKVCYSQKGGLVSFSGLDTSRKAKKHVAGKCITADPELPFEEEQNNPAPECQPGNFKIVKSAMPKGGAK